MISAILTILSSFFNVLLAWFSCDIILTDNINISIKAIVIFLWTLWFSLQIIHMFTHIHGSGGETYNGRD